MKRFAVVGANGYIARSLVYTLKKEYPDSERLLYDIAPAHADGEPNYRSVNLLNGDELSRLDLNCDIIFMFVGKTGSANGFDAPETFIKINELALLNLLNEYRRQKSSAKIVFPSTRLVYRGRPGPLSENAEKEFKTVYAINKFAGEQYLEQYHRVFGVRYCIFRICLPYGTLVPGASSYGTAEFMISKAARGENISLYGDGEVRRTLTYIGDLCEMLIKGALCDRCENDVFNIGGEDYSLKEMAEQIAPIYGVGVEYVPWPEIAEKIESGDTVFDDAKLQKACPYRYRQRFSLWCKEQSLKK